jgi:hypothetical protein
MGTIFSTLHADASELVAMLLVGFYAWGRFNTPSTVRSQTSRFQYFASGIAYTLSCIGLLAGLAWLIGQNPRILGFLHTGAAAALPDELRGLDNALIAALVLTTLLPHFPVLRELDQRMLRLFHRMGAIPFGAVLWSQRMDNAEMVISERMLAATRLFIRNQAGLADSLADELTADADADLVRVFFTRNMALYAEITRLPGAKRFADQFPDDMAEFEKSLGRFFTQSVGYFAVMAHIAGRQSAAPAGAVEDSVRSYRSLALETYEVLRLTLARILLTTCNGEAEVAQRLRAVGYAIESAPPIQVPANLLALDLFGVVLLFVVSTMISGQQNPSLALSIGVLVALNHCIAAFFALLPKQIWQFADPRQAGERPVLAYLLSGAATVTICLPIAYAFYWMRVHFLTPPLMSFGLQSRWLALSFALAVALAFACDDAVRREAEPAWLRWAEAAALALVMAGTSGLVVHWIANDLQVMTHGKSLPPFWTGSLLSACIGALFGATIPRWYRDTLRATGARPAPAPAKGAAAPPRMAAGLGA